AHRDHLCIPCSKIEQGIQSRGSKFDENYCLRWVSSAWTSTAQIRDAEKYVQATNIISTSALDRMRIFSEAQGSFRESGKTGAAALEAAKVMTPVLATYEIAMSTLEGSSHAKAEGSMRDLNKTIEMMGGLSDTKRAQEIADGMFKASQSSGRMVDERQLKQFFAFGSSASNQQLLRTVFGGLEPIIGEMGGSTVGTGMRTAYNRVNGTMALVPKNVRRELKRLGMAADATGMEQTSDLARMQASDIIGYTQEMMRRYEKAGITSQIDRERENSILFGTNGAKVYNKIMSQMSVIGESLKSYDKAKGASDTVNNPANQRLQAQLRFEKKIEDLQLVVGRDGGLLDMLNTGLGFLGGAIERVTKFAERHPTLTKFAVAGFALLSVVAIIGGAFLIAAAAVTFLGAPLTAAIALVGGLATALLIFGRKIVAWWKTLPTWLGGDGNKSPPAASVSPAVAGGQKHDFSALNAHLGIPGLPGLPGAPGIPGLPGAPGLPATVPPPDKGDKSVARASGSPFVRARTPSVNVTAYVDNGAGFEKGVTRVVGGIVSKSSAPLGSGFYDSGLSQPSPGQGY
ncbi:hypothetical protein, partial [Burkholderia vietnamiensis]|uniref:hypothetical protein n=1 Tax=Burkholderia vietnamiensis TaxID=60552 RepID=UPI0015943928